MLRDALPVCGIRLSIFACTAGIHIKSSENTEGSPPSSSSLLHLAVSPRTGCPLFLPSYTEGADTETHAPHFSRTNPHVSLFLAAQWSSCSRRRAGWRELRARLPPTRRRGRGGSAGRRRYKRSRGEGVRRKREGRAGERGSGERTFAGNEDVVGFSACAVTGSHFCAAPKLAAHQSVRRLPSSIPPHPAHSLHSHVALSCRRARCSRSSRTS